MLSRILHKLSSMSLRRQVIRQLHSVLEKRIDMTERNAAALQRTLCDAGNHVPYYRDLFQRLVIDPARPEDFWRIPLLTKALIKSNRDSLTSDRLARLWSFKGNTGGSTGTPLEFLLNTEVGVVSSAEQEFFWRYMGYRASEDKIAAFDGVLIPDDLLGRHVYWQTRPHGRDMPYGRTRFSSFKLNGSTVQHYLRELSAGQYTMLYGYPSSIAHLALLYRDHGAGVPLRIKACQLTSEYASSQQVQQIREAFNCEVHLQYGQGEACFYAHTYDRSLEYLCSPVHGMVEVLDESGKHVAVGAEGEVVATSFWNLAMPFIRYQTGDKAVYGGVRNGVTYLTSVTGRTQDIIYRKDLSRVSLTGLVFGQHFKCFHRIRVWQIVQDVPGEVVIRIDPDADFTDNDETELASTFRDVGDVHTTVVRTTEFVLTDRGKRRFMVQRVRPD